mmetsp:Transcript_630/g.2379  ORF Transcript_630/g.2379 Transcript_630/m.2379 type:complete len:101 (-) Transcript_630:14579-14881(-)
MDQIFDVVEDTSKWTLSVPCHEGRFRCLLQHGVELSKRLAASLSIFLIFALLQRFHANPDTPQALKLIPQRMMESMDTSLQKCLVTIRLSQEMVQKRSSV